MSEEQETKPVSKFDFLRELVNFTVDDARALLAFCIVFFFGIMYYTAMPNSATMGQVLRDWGWLVAIVITWYFAAKNKSDVQVQPIELEIVEKTEPEELEPIVASVMTIEDVVKQVTPIIIQTVADAVALAIAAQVPVVNTSGYVAETPVETPATDTTEKAPPATDATVTSPVETA